MQTCNSGEIPIIQVSSRQRITSSTSSKGNQLKWFQNGYWLKADYLGYEGLAEILISQLMCQTNFNEQYGVVQYMPCWIVEDGVKKYRGCCSRNYLAPNEQEITLGRLLRKITGKTPDLLKKHSGNWHKDCTRIVTQCYGLQDVAQYLALLFQADRISLNEDRHYHNIVFKVRETPNGLLYTYTPLFDNGAGLFSDTKQDYPINISITECKKIVKAKPFNRDFNKQVQNANNLCVEYFGRFPELEFDMVFTGGQPPIINISQLKGMYKAEELERAVTVLTRQVSTYMGEKLFCIK